MLNARKIPDEALFALVDAYNRKQLDEVVTGTKFHAAQLESVSVPAYGQAATITRSTITPANATDAATALVLVNAVKAVVDRHFADTIAHDTAISAAITIADATDTTTAITLVNDLKAKYNVHRTAGSVHFNNDSTNDTTNANATDAATLVTLVNEVKADVNAHIASAPTGTFVNLINA